MPAGGECPNVKYQFLSPVDYYDNVACCVYPDGNVSGYTGVTFSCRRSSPGVDADNYAYFVHQDGVVEAGLGSGHVDWGTCGYILYSK